MCWSFISPSKKQTNNIFTEVCFERLDSPGHKVVNSPAYDGVVEHSHVDVDHTDSVTNLGKGEDG